MTSVNKRPHLQRRKKEPLLEPWGQCLTTIRPVGQGRLSCDPATHAQRARVCTGVREQQRALRCSERTQTGPHCLTQHGHEPVRSDPTPFLGSSAKGRPKPPNSQHTPWAACELARWRPLGRAGQSLGHSANRASRVATNERGRSSFKKGKTRSPKRVFVFGAWGAGVENTDVGSCWGWGLLGGGGGGAPLHVTSASRL